ncbi:dihydrofolate reductase family protein [Gordonia sp. X0973]|uniref:dihydrofolate reductase family protein n=1 Tax=Gordonia sp. X0973 TaxID=2742602 RepID=UPI000F5351BB|nr:dihydrofolate reductase family protein [Gordonia sp. X0973]QKT08184.1 dihydrofolate reductase family protein [Gordonia sp. X0973]
MRPLRYSINVTVDGCCDHLAGRPDEELHDYTAAIMGRADTLLFGRVVYEMMESAWRVPDDEQSDDPFVATINAMPKYVVSRTLSTVDWNAQLVRGDLRAAVTELKEQPGTGIYTGGVTLPLALAQLGLIDEYEFIVHPRIAGRGPTPFAGLREFVDLRLIGRTELASGAVALRYEPQR